MAKNKIEEKSEKKPKWKSPPMFALRGGVFCLDLCLLGGLNAKTQYLFFPIYPLF